MILFIVYNVVVHFILLCAMPYLLVRALYDFSRSPDGQSTVPPASSNRYGAVIRGPWARRRELCVVAGPTP